MNLREQILALNAQIAALEAELDTATMERIAEIDTEVKGLIKDRNKLEAEMRAQVRRGFQAGTPEARTTETDEQIEERARKLIQGRSISIDAVDVLSIDHQASDIKPTFNQVSSLVDQIGIVSLNGGESFKQAYLKGYATGGYTAEGGAYNVTEPTWDYAEISKVKITAYTEVSEEFEKLAPSAYLAEIKRNLGVALKRKLAIEVLKGDGASGHLVGIFDATHATAIETAKDISISAIDENTLDTLIFGFGGDEDLSEGVLILSKADLRAFSQVRGTQDKKKVYNIDTKNKTIDGIPYVINGAITPLATASAGDYIMAYGTLAGYKLVSFAAIEMAKSTDFKFSTGQIAYKASGFFGGNVAAFNAFLRVKKSA